MQLGISFRLWGYIHINLLSFALNIVVCYPFFITCYNIVNRVSLQNAFAIRIGLPKQEIIWTQYCFIVRTSTSTVYDTDLAMNRISVYTWYEAFFTGCSISRI